MLIYQIFLSATLLFIVPVDLKMVGIELYLYTSALNMFWVN